MVKLMSYPTTNLYVMAPTSIETRGLIRAMMDGAIQFDTAKTA